MDQEIMWSKLHTILVDCKTILKPYYHKTIGLIKSFRRVGLSCRDFSIISNNCTGGYVYQYFGIEYATPTEGLYLIPDDYLRLISNPKYYFTHQVRIIDSTESVLGRKGVKIDYPVGIVDDIELYFMHYKTPQEAIEKWYRRSSRINYSKLIYLFTETELVDLKHIYTFSEIINKYGHGYCLTNSKYNLPHTYFVPNVPINEVNGYPSWTPKTIINSLDWKRIINQF